MGELNAPPGGVPRPACRRVPGTAQHGPFGTGPALEQGLFPAAEPSARTIPAAGGAGSLRLLLTPDSLDRHAECVQAAAGRNE